MTEILLLTSMGEIELESTKAISEVPEVYSRIRRPIMDWQVHQPAVRFDIRAERAECEYLLKHPARVLQDRLVRLGGGDRTRKIPISEWERVYQREARARRLLHQARVLAWGREKRYYHAHKLA